VIVVGIDRQCEAVRFGILVATHQLTRNSRRLAVVHPGRHIQRLVIVGDPQLGGLGDRLPFLRIALSERRHGGRPQPDLVGQQTVHHDGRRRADGVDHRHRPVRRPGLGGRPRSGRQDEHAKE
jgi:hypothetical protein